MEVLAFCGLEDQADTPAANLPIGTARLVELARALVQPPSVLLLDEPASGLDGDELQRFAEVVHRTRDEGTAVLLVEHDVAFVLEHCDRVVVLHLGQVLAEGTPEVIRADAEVRDAYLGAAI